MARRSLSSPKKKGGDTRIYIGDKNVFLPRGPYTYTIKYRTANQTRHFDGHAEVYWNVTGNDWIFPIEKATTKVVLPTGGVIQDTVFFTGKAGSRANNAVAEIIDGNIATFETTAPLKQREGFTVAVKFDIGLIPTPEKVRYYSGIDSFHSEMTLDASGDLSVVERYKITVTPTDPLRHALVRDLEKPVGREKSRNVDLTDVTVTRNGEPLKARFYSSRYQEKIYLGSYGKRTPEGQHDFEVRYRVSRRVMFGDDRDSLTWHALPKGFKDMRVAEASARITVPASASDVTSDFSLGKDATADRSGVTIATDGNAVRYSFSAPIKAYDQFALSVSLPKGVIAEPKLMKRLGYFWRDNRQLLIGYILAALIGLYYLLAWIFVGRDPTGKAIVPTWEAPEGVSPAMVSYIEHEGLSGSGRNAMSAALINLGVRGLITMHGFDETLTVKRTDTTKPANLPVGEAALLGKLDKRGLSFNRTNATKVSGLRTAFSTAMTNEHRSQYFRKNWVWFVFGVLLSIIAVGFYVFQDSSFANRTIENSFPLVVMSVFAAFVINIGLQIVRSFTRGTLLQSRIRVVVMVGFFAYFLFNAGTMMLLEPIRLISSLEIDIGLPILGIIGLNVLFWFLIGAPTKLGREIMDKIDGLRLYLEMAEADRMNMAGAPAMTPQHFETLLPYAVALKVEKPWAESFERWLSQPVPADGGPRTYRSSWNRDWSNGGFDPSMNFGNSVASSFASAIPRSSASSSGGFSGGSSSGFSGGGSSGGGGGDGGGGGW